MTATAAVDTARLSALEGMIERGIRTFVEVGAALLEIRESRLYRASHGTFEEYCRERWGWSRVHAHRQIEAAKVASNLLPIGNTLSTESQAREFTPLSGEQQREVSQAIAEAGRILAEMPAREIGEIVARVQNGTPANLAVHFSSDSEEWYTPPDIIQRVRGVLGRIDLDPCSDEASTVPASRRFTRQEDGLTQPWKGRVYMNPPYGRVIGAWVDKLCSAYQDGSVTSAIALVPARVDTDWFRCFRDHAVCFIDGRLKFSGHENSAPFPSAAVYLGQDVETFNIHFGPIGDVWIRWSRGQG